MGGEGVEPSPPCEEGILSPSCLPFHHPPIKSLKEMEAAQGFEPWIMDLQSTALVHLAMPPQLKPIISWSIYKCYRYDYPHG